MRCNRVKHELAPHRRHIINATDYGVTKAPREVRAEQNRSERAESRTLTVRSLTAPTIPTAAPKGLPQAERAGRPIERAVAADFTMSNSVALQWAARGRTASILSANLVPSSRNGAGNVRSAVVTAENPSGTIHLTMSWARCSSSISRSSPVGLADHQN